MEEAERYRQKWAALRRLERTYLRLFAGVVSLAAVGLLHHWWRPLQYVILATIPLMLAAVVTNIRLTFWKCPRCSKSYFSGTFAKNLFSKKCRHCALPKYSLDPNA